MAFKRAYSLKATITLMSGGELRVGSSNRSLHARLTPFFKGGLSDRVVNGNLETPDRFDETDGTYFYFLWEDLDGEWLIEQQERANATRRFASQAENAGLSFTQAWDDRATLSYG